MCKLNPLHAKLFRGNMKHIFTFYVIPPTDVTQLVEILPQIRQEPAYSMKSISWLLMSWWYRGPGHSNDDIDLDKPRLLSPCTLRVNVLVCGHINSLLLQTMMGLPTSKLQIIISSNFECHWISVYIYSTCGLICLCVTVTCPNWLSYNSLTILLVYSACMT